jgi:hypothetical protein
MQLVFIVELFGKLRELSRFRAVQNSVALKTPRYYRPTGARQWLITYRKADAKVSHIDKELRRHGHKYSRKTITKVVDELGLPREKRGK